MVDRHVLAVGRTGTGKTRHLLGYALRGKRVLYFNTQGEDAPWPGLAVADRRIALADLWPGLALGPVNYVPHDETPVARAELDVLVADAMRREWRPPLVLCVDEADVFAPEGGRPGPLERLAKRGRKQGVFLYAITQHPADLSKQVVRNVRRHVVFRLDYSAAYYRHHRLPAEEIEGALALSPSPHAYVVYEDGEVRGPFVDPG